MLFNAYSDTTVGIFDVYLKSAGHIFVKRSKRKPVYHRKNIEKA